MITAKAGTAHTCERIDVMTQALHMSRIVSPPQGLTVQNAYTELRKGGKNVIVVVKQQHSLSPDHKEEDPSSKGSCGYFVYLCPLYKLA